MRTWQVVCRESSESAEAFAAFKSARYWPVLDGLRAVSVVLVLAVHTHDPMWQIINGSLGVTLFFVISGFLITTLLIREEGNYGRVSISRFYIRRFFRIVPLYFVALGVFTMLVLMFQQGSGTSGYLDRLPLLSTFNGDLAGSGTFSHSWSLGIEEKFYFLWPIAAFGISLCRCYRLPVLQVLVLLAAVASFIPGLGYFGIYLPILGGCLVAILAHSRATFALLYGLSGRNASFFCFAFLVLFLFTDKLLPFDESSRYAHTVFAVAAILFLPALLLSNFRIGKFLSNPILVHVGIRAYAVYLFHPLCLELVDKVAAPGSESILMQLVRFLALVISSLLISEVLARAVERPGISLGRRLIASMPRREASSAEVDR
ncbi:acyltransferase family protein [Rhodococcus sp. 15-2388-1-1a]|uniref:acyltransferase family protein n=1 Tax=Rhodococcus sp. 15-2388-1-1a TaxID=2023142 RepID=UPI0034E9746A